MAAPRKYSTYQRQELYRLYEAGKSPAEIAQLVERGTAGMSPFRIPRRTVHEIVTKMAQEAEQKLPTSFADAEDAEAVGRYPARIAGIVKAEIDRLEGKQQRSGLSPEDLTRLKKAMELSSALEKRLSRGSSQGARRSRTPRRASKSRESGTERLLREEREEREERERAGAREEPSRARTCHDSGDPGSEQLASGPTAGAPAQPESSCGPGTAAAAPKTPAERVAAAAKARAALGQS